ncbi:alpha/beta hydrolase [Actibacterium sp. 188UL27-1]|uniref:alpha/beta hydrolase n=1 Tax=Actibacterium sp. 188UL27-1 TaxID=2786961 RepID=UPI00195CDF60|nr:alpha/beta hydrolase [Actibacterium sp. 188UL27-1]MBM7066607.1 alpha/beta hydrolase [Actibacterium sp. 188UL27-1]
MTSRTQHIFNLMARYVQKPMLRNIAHQPTLRAILDNQAAVMYRPPPGVREAFRNLPGGLKARWITPRSDHPFALLYLHGGAFTIGSSRSHRWLAARIGLGCAAGALVPDYRLAPEHPFPAALDDAVTAYRYLLDQGFRGDQIAVSGDSAGGNLALALMGKLTAGDLPKPAALALLSPLTDMTFNSPTIAENRHRDLLVPVEWGQRTAPMYAPGMELNDPRLSPLFADHTDTPPTVIHVADNEVLLADSTRLADRLQEAGREVELELFENVPHVWQIKAGLSPEADRSVAGMSAFLARHLRP